MTAQPAISEAKLRERLREDFTYYAPRCLRIRPKEGGLIPLNLNTVQKRVHAELEAQKRRLGYVRALVLKARQPGISTLIEARFYQQVTHRFGVKAFILTHHSDATENLFTMTERFHNNCPDPVKPATGAANAKELQFEFLDSSFEVGTARTGGIGRSDTIQFLHGSEVAFWENADKHVDGLLQAVPKAPDTEVILESTANGPGGVFYNMCKAAERGEGDYILIFVPWFEHGEYQQKPPEDWVQPEEFREYQELHDLEDDQIYWAYAKNHELVTPLGGSPDKIGPKFRQEYPATAQEAFQTTTEDVLIQPNTVLRARKNHLETWSGVPLILGLDIARGGGDLTRIIDRQGRIVGRHISITDGVIDSDNLMEVVGWTASWLIKLKPDHLFVDITGLGAGVYDRLDELGYERITGVNFGARANDSEAYANKRAELWGEMNKWLLDEIGADLPDEDIFSTHLCAPRKGWDSNSRLLLEDKKLIKKRLHFSPDLGDSVGLTFAENVEPLNERGYSVGQDVGVETYDDPEF